MSSAVFSRCGRYRHLLTRDVLKDGPVVGFFGVNASTAGKDNEDQTTRKWNGFCRVQGWSRYLVANPFDLIATDVAELARHPEPCSRANRRYVRQVLDEAEILVPCWGNRGKLPRQLWPRLDELREMIFATLKPVLVFGLTASGDPRHPLMLPYSTQMAEWNPTFYME